MLRLTALFICLTLTSCAGMIPQPDPQKIREIDAYFDASQTKHEDDGPFKTAIAYDIGQYVVQGMTETSGRSIMIMAIVGQEGGNWILETRSLTPTTDSISQMAVKGLEAVASSGSLKELDIIWMKTKSNGQPIQKLDGTLLNMAEGLVKPALAGLVIKPQQVLDGGMIQTPAGAFKGTTKATTTISFLGTSHAATTWLHPAVPLNGMVRSVTKDGETIELLDFGLEGATRSF